MKVVVGEVGRKSSLIGVGEADAEGVGADVALVVDGDVGVRTDGGDLRDLSLRYDGGRSDVDSAGVRSDDGADSVAFNHTADGVDRVFVAGLCVIGDEFDGASEDSALRVDVVDYEFSHVHFGDSVLGEVTGERGKVADLDRFSRKSGSCC